MKNMKLFISLMIAIVFSISTLSACAPEEPIQSSVEISSSESIVESDTDELEELRAQILSDIEFAERDAPQSEYDFGGKTVIFGSPWTHDLFLQPGTSQAGDKFLERVRQVEEDYNVVIETATAEYGYFCDQIFTAAQAGIKFADIIELDSRWLSILAYPGFIKPLNQVKTGVNIKEAKWHPTQLMATKFNNGIYGVKAYPVEAQNLIFWNKTLFEEQNLPNLYDLYDQKLWTWDKMKEIAQQATIIASDGFVEQWGLGGAETERSLILSNDGTIMAEDSEGKLRFAMNNPKTIFALEYLQDLLYGSKVMEPVNVTADWRYQFEQFTNRVYAMVHSPFYAVDVWYQFMEDDFGVVPFPIGPEMDDYIMPAELNRNWALINNNPDEDIASIIMDALFSPYEDEDEDSWKTRYTDVLRDDKSMEIIEYLLSENRFKLDLTGYFPEVGTSSAIIGWYKNPNNNIYYSVFTNQKTPAAAISEKEEQAKTLVDDFYANLNPQDTGE